MKSKDALNRRNFLKTSGAVSLGMTALNRRALGGVGPNETIRIACIGVGGMGTGRLKEFLRQKDCEVVAVCDVDSSHAERAATLSEEAQDRRPDVYGDFRRVIERDDIDAVSVTTPDHWHAIPFVWACQSGKDVFVEKPLSYCYYEGKVMAATARENGCITQMGNHIHAGQNYRQVVRIVQSGVLGDISRAQVWKTSGISNLGTPVDSDPPSNLDYNFWLGPAPERPYNRLRSHFHFRYFWDYANGVFSDFWCHISDIAYWALDLDAPKTVSAVGKRFHIKDSTETPNIMEVQYDFGDFPLTFTLNPEGIPGFPHMGGIGCMIQGTKGTVVTNYDKHEVYLRNRKVPDSDLDLKNPELPRSPGHIRQFADGIKSRVQCDCNVQYAHKLTTGMHLGVIAYKTGETITWDAQREKIVGNSKANRLLKRRYRRPWKLT